MTSAEIAAEPSGRSRAKRRKSAARATSSCSSTSSSSYFGFVSGAVERALQRAPESKRGPLARDVFTLFHYPIVLGIVFFAVAAKKTVAHPEDARSRAGRAALGFGVALFLLGFLLGRYRIVRTIGRERAVAAVLALVCVVLLRSLPSAALFATVTGIVAVAVVIERIRYRAAPPSARSVAPLT